MEERDAGSGCIGDGDCCGDACGRDRLRVRLVGEFAGGREGARTLFTVVGDLDFACAGAFAAALAAIAANGADPVLDMAGVAFIDSAALDAMDRVQRLFAILGLTLTVRSSSRPVRRLLGLCQLDGLIEQPEATVSEMFGPTRPGQSGLGTPAMFGS
jgi:anti-anti-sigma factor